MRASKASTPLPFAIARTKRKTEPVRIFVGEAVEQRVIRAPA
jgi:hypothetical protein